MSLSFLRGLLKNPVKTGALAPSSAYLAQEILRHWPKRDSGVVVEYGPGTGSFTRAISKKLKGESFVTLEMNSHFAKDIRKKFPYLDLYFGSAEDVDLALSEFNLDSIDLVVSGLPWAVFGAELQKSILKKTHDKMNPEAVFSTFAYVHALKLPKAVSFHKLLLATFSKVEISSVVWMNIPPAIVYHCTK